MKKINYIFDQVTEEKIKKSSENGLTYRGLILSSSDLLLLKKAREITPLKIFMKKEKQKKYDYFVKHTQKNFLISSIFFLQQQLNYIALKQQKAIIGFGIGKSIFEKLMIEKGGKEKVTFKKNRERIEVLKTYSFNFSDSLFLRKEIGLKIEKKKVYLNNKFHFFVFVRRFFDNLVFMFNVENGIISIKYCIKRQTYLNNEWVDTF